MTYISSSDEVNFDQLDAAIAADLNKHVKDQTTLAQGPIIHPGEDGKVRFTNVYTTKHAKGDENNKAFVLR